MKRIGLTEGEGRLCSSCLLAGKKVGQRPNGVPGTRINGEKDYYPLHAIVLNNGISRLLRVGGLFQ